MKRTNMKTSKTKKTKQVIHFVPGMQPISELKKHYEQVQIDAGLKAKKEPKFPLFPELG